MARRLHFIGVGNYCTFCGCVLLNPVFRTTLEEIVSDEQPNATLSPELWSASPFNCEKIPAPTGKKEKAK